MNYSLAEHGLSEQEKAEISFFNRLYFDNIGYYENAFSHRAARENPDFFIVFLCVGGKGYLNLSDKHFDISPGEIFFSFPDMPHVYGADNENPWSIYWAHFHAADGQFAEMLQKNGITPESPVLHTRHWQETAGLYKTILAGIYHSTADELRYKQCVFTELLFKILLFTADKSQKDPYVSLATAYIHDNLNRPLPLDEIAAAAGISKFYLSHRFSEIMGVSVRQYILAQRLNQAKFLLESTDKSIGEIACDCGYENGMHFSSSFKKHIGISPKYYRKPRLPA